MSCCENVAMIHVEYTKHFDAHSQPNWTKPFPSCTYFLLMTHVFLSKRSRIECVRMIPHNCVRANCHGVGPLELPRKVVPSLSRRKTRRESLAPTTHAEYDTYGYRAQPFFPENFVLPGNKQCKMPRCSNSKQHTVHDLPKALKMLQSACMLHAIRDHCKDSCALRTPHAIIGTYNAAKQHCHAGHELCCPHIRNKRAPGSAFAGNAHLTILILLARRLNFLPALKM